MRICVALPVSSDVKSREPRVKTSKYGYLLSGSHSDDNEGGVLSHSLRGAMSKRTNSTGRSGGAPKPTLPKLTLPPAYDDDDEEEKLT